MHEYEALVLAFLKKRKSSTMEELKEEVGLGQDQIMWALENLSGRGAVKVSKETRVDATLTEEGERYTDGFPEERLAREIRKAGQIDIGKAGSQIAITWAKNNGWVIIKAGKLILTKEGEKAASGDSYPQRESLNAIRSGKAVDRKMVSLLESRHLIQTVEKKATGAITITPAGEKLEVREDFGIGQLSKEMIKSREWEKKGLRAYDISAPSERTMPARLHPLTELIDAVRNTWLRMGFSEISGPIIEPAFWTFDALFSPQDHPTREMQDTFYLANPKLLDVKDMELLKSVKRMQEKGWGEKWREELAKQAVLRTHTTSVSVRYIRRFANEMQTSYPIKLFSVGKVFRNESIDYKHVAELYQHDGIVMGDNLTLANLIYIMRKFYSALGIEIRVKPAYFPFVEPGLEVFYYNEKYKEWMELNGGGVIRKEITKAMGTNKTVLAWGGGIDRLMFNCMDIDSLITLYKNDPDWLRARSELNMGD
ncbi:MAG: phenylalanine--tRNA ligase subunit alpha [Candidatus Micrarchaeota archaeon]|nr:phenylalanine--tRNA ligase subunit alpha [Candidatus Micrarchaeota archaeon]